MSGNSTGGWRTASGVAGVAVAAVLAGCGGGAADADCGAVQEAFERTVTRAVDEAEQLPEADGADVTAVADEAVDEALRLQEAHADCFETEALEFLDPARDEPDGWATPFGHAADDAALEGTTDVLGDAP